MLQRVQHGNRCFRRVCIFFVQDSYYRSHVNKP
jgi:hypothetical protein